MVKLEQERIVLAQPNGRVEVQPQPDNAIPNTIPEVVVFQESKAKRRRAEALIENASLVAEGFRNGWDRYLTEKQDIAVRRYLEADDRGRIPSLEVWRRRLRGSGTADITRQGLNFDEQGGLIKLVRLQRGEPARGSRKLKMDHTTRELLLQNKRLPMKKLRDLVGHSIVVVRRFRDELEIPRNPSGRQRKSDPSSE